MLSSRVESSESCYELLFFFVEGLRIRGLFEELGVRAPGSFWQEVVRAAPGPLVASYRFAFSCQSLRVCGCLNLDDCEGRRELAIVET